MAKKTYETVLIERARPHRTRGRFKVVRVPTAMLREATGSSEPFKPVVDLQALAKQRRLADVLFPLCVFGPFVVAAGEIGIFSSTNIANPSNPAGLGVAIALVVATVASGFSAGVIADKRAASRSKAYGHRTVQALRVWLRDRYALNVSAAALQKGADYFLLAEQRVGSELPFRDEENKPFRLVASEGGLFVKEVPEAAAPLDRDYAPSGTVAALSPAKGGNAEGVACASEAELAALLEGDAQALHSRTAALLTTLDNRALSVEHRHVVNRARADVNQLLVLNRELTELGEVDAEAQAQLAQVLSSLNGELVEVLEAERGAIKQSIATQVDYVKQRRADPGNPALQLSAAERFDRHLLALDPEPKLAAAMRKVAELEEASE